MSRSRAALVALLLVACAACAKVNQPGTAFKWTPTVKPAEYFPLAAGTAWSYEATDPANGQKVLVVNRVQSRDGNRAVMASGPDPLAYEDTGEEIVLVPSRKPILKAPIARGTSWPAGAGTATIRAVDAVAETPAGRYRSCVAVEELAADRRVLTVFAPHVGPVQLEVYAREGGSEVLVSRALLKSYHDAAAETP